MSDKPVICNLCREEITDEKEQVARVYVVRATGVRLPDQRKHDICNDLYAKEKTGLRKIR